MHGPLKFKFHSFFDFGVRWGEWSTPFPVRFTPGKDEVSSIKGNKPYMCKGKSKVIPLQARCCPEGGCSSTLP